MVPRRGGAKVRRRRRRWWRWIGYALRTARQRRVFLHAYLPSRIETYAGIDAMYHSISPRGRPKLIAERYEYGSARCARCAPLHPTDPSPPSPSFSSTSRLFFSYLRPFASLSLFSFFYFLHARLRSCCVSARASGCVYLCARWRGVRRVPAGAIVAAQITMPDRRRRGQTF